MGKTSDQPRVMYIRVWAGVLSVEERDGLNMQDYKKMHQ